jgi:hypothetical protein
LLRGDGIAGLLQIGCLDLIEVGIHCWIERIKVFSKPERMELVAALGKCLAERNARAAAFVSQEGKKADLHVIAGVHIAAGYNPIDFRYNRTFPVPG